MTRCEFLVREVSKSCTTCTGWFCVAKGRKKKVGDTTICNNDEQWSICTRYLQVYPEQKPLPPTEPESKLEQELEIFTSISDEATWTEIDLTTSDSTYSMAPSINWLNQIEEPEPPKPRLPRVNCPYLGSPPTGVVTCCGMYCYADNEALRTGTQCTSRPSWLECVKRIRAVNRGVPYASS